MGSHNTINDDTGRLSAEDVVIDFLSKKGIVDKTEKLALARISNKTGINIEQVEVSISRLSAKNLIRKVYLQGNVGFELTPRGKQALEVLAKAETERITRQLQESISQERKAKLRLSTVNKMKSLEEKWKNYQIPDIKQINEVEQEATKLLAVTKEISDKQPLCKKSPENYEQEFAQYKPQIESLTEQNNRINKAVSNYVRIKDYLSSMSANNESIKKSIKKYEPFPEAEAQVQQLKAAFFSVKSIQSQLENFDKTQLSRLEELRTKLVENSRLLESLKKPTHEFVPIKRDSSPEKGIMYPDPECPIKYSNKASVYPLMEKCGKCGTKRKSTPVTIG